jgi:hypothetical protein
MRPMSSAPSIAIKSANASRLAAFLSQPLCIAFTVLALVTALRTTGTVDSDVAWQLWIAERMHSGAHLYRDIIEINPPLWFWMALPVDRASELFHLRPETALVLAIGASAMLAIAATDRLLHHIAPQRRGLLLAYAALTLMGMPWMHVGQREQLVLIGTLPYAALIASRRLARPVPPLLAALVGVGAALCFALKHYFLIVPALLEIWLVVRAKSNWRLLRPEILGLVAVGALYAGAILLFAPDYLTRIVPLVSLAYGVTGAPSFLYLFGPFALIGLFTLGFVLAHARLLDGPAAPFSLSLVVAAIGFACVYFIQSKGWIYHSIPLVGCASLALAALVAETRGPTRLLRIAAPALLSFPMLLAFQEQRYPINPSPDLQDAVSGLRPGDTVGFLAVETAIPWSITLQRGLRFPSRYMGYWMLNAVVNDEQSVHPDPRLAGLGRQVVAETVSDFTCTPPRRLIVPRPRPGDRGFDVLPFFLRDPKFAALLTHYKVKERTGLETYEQVSALPLPTSPCRPGV